MTLPYNTIPAPLPAPPRMDRRAKPHRMLRFDLIARFAIIAGATITCLLAWCVPASLTAQVLAEGGSAGRLVLLLLTGCMLVGWLDIVVNDMMPDRWHCRWAKRNLHRGYSVIAMLYLLQAYASLGDALGPEDLLALGYTVNAGISGWYAWTTAVRGWHV